MADDGRDATLIYVADPMCSWCWGFAPVLEEVCAALPAAGFELVLGGLAPDDDAPMDEATRRYVQGAWDAVEARTGARFNRDFWTRCAPRRSTWPACRAVLVAEELAPGSGGALFRALQRAYYLEARNPSEPDTLRAVFGEVVAGADLEAFAAALDGEPARAELTRHLRRRDELGAPSFPTLLLAREGGVHLLARGYAPAPAVLERLRETAAS